MTLDLAKELISRRSVTPDDNGCQQLIAERLAAGGFRCEHLRYGHVDNVWLTHGIGSPVFVFLGHTDVVPSGPVDAWQSDPFTPALRDGYLYGRGAADMKGSVAAMVTALERYSAGHGDHRGTAALLLTSDEEGRARDGTRRVVQHLRGIGTRIDWCLVGEPSSRDHLGDVVKNGRRGSLTGALTVRGVQGHVAYPESADNPIHCIAPALVDLCAERWDEGNEFYPPTGFQVSNIHAGTGADNVIPGSLEMLFNFRFSTSVTEDELKRRTSRILERHGLGFHIDWRPANPPFLTPAGALLDAVTAVLKETVGAAPEVSTGGGTSDGRFVAPTGAQVVELGPLNGTAHKVDECVSVDDLERLSTIYERILERLLNG